MDQNGRGTDETQRGGSRANVSREISPSAHSGGHGDDGGLLNAVDKGIAESERVRGDAEDVKLQHQDYPVVTSQPGLLRQRTALRQAPPQVPEAVQRPPHASNVGGPGPELDRAGIHFQPIRTSFLDSLCCSTRHPNE